MYLSVIVPVFNEAAVIRETLQKIDFFLEQKGWASEIIVVNDGSTDNSLEEIRAAGLINLKLISHSSNLGKGAAVKKGMLNASGDLLLFLDADYSTDINQLENFLPYLNKGYDIVIGSRGLRDSKITVSQSKIKVLSGKLGLALTHLLVVPGIKDTQCGFKLFKKNCLSIFRQQTLSGWGFDFELLFLASKQNLKVAEVAVEWKNRSDSKVKTFDYFRTLLELIKIRINNLSGIYDKN